MTKRTVDPQSVERAKAKLVRVSDKRNAAADKATEATDRLYSEIHHAWEAGMTYMDIAEVIGMTDIRVYQILKEQRRLRGSRAS